jgi:hypothetical protein
MRQITPQSYWKFSEIFPVSDWFSSSKKNIENHKGVITAHSKKGKGATLEILSARIIAK